MVRERKRYNLLLSHDIQITEVDQAGINRDHRQWHLRFEGGIQDDSVLIGNSGGCNHPRVLNGLVIEQHVCLHGAALANRESLPA